MSTSLLIVPSSYIISIYLNWTSLGIASVNSTSFKYMSDKFCAVNVYTKSSPADIVVPSGIFAVCAILIPGLFIVTDISLIFSVSVPSAFTLLVTVTSFLYTPSESFPTFAFTVKIFPLSPSTSPMLTVTFLPFTFTFVVDVISSYWAVSSFNFVSWIDSYSNSSGKLNVTTVFFLLLSSLPYSSL